MSRTGPHSLTLRATDPRGSRPTPSGDRPPLGSTLRLMSSRDAQSVPLEGSVHLGGGRVRVATASLNQRIADELGVPERQVSAAVGLLDGGATVPFVARYRKEATGGLDDAQPRTLQERLDYLRELEERRTAILNSIREQGKLDDELEAKIMAVDSKARLEDLYLPFKPKRRTKAQIAREAGLEPLAKGLLTDPSQEPQAAAAPYVDPDKGVPDAA